MPMDVLQTGTSNGLVFIGSPVHLPKVKFDRISNKYGIKASADPKIPIGYHSKPDEYKEILIPFQVIPVETP